MCQVSSYSRSGTLAMVIPPPTGNCNRFPFCVNVRISKLASHAPSKPAYSSEPQYGPRTTCSSSVMISIAQDLRRTGDRSARPCGAEQVPHVAIGG
ncbi:MAG: hypothetical protein QM811_20075 [Pirellulales bacterium]